MASSSTYNAFSPSANPHPPSPSLDASLENDPDIDMAAPSDAPPLNPENPDFSNPADLDPSTLDPATDVRIPARKDISLREFLSKMDDYAPIIPDAVTAHHLSLAGLPPPNLSSSSTAPPSPNATPLPLARLLALATQKFIADIAADAYQYSRMRNANSSSAATAAAAMNPAGGGPGGGAVGGTAAAAGGTGAGAAGGAGGAKGTGQHVLGVQRAGFGGGGTGGGAGRTVLTMEDLGMAVGEYGVNVRRGEFYR
ncbi:hypothetical protein MMC20_006871 [Loxospora ochrophaea]|nr:hypothetical protein [Loxospora ochrophaea]